MGKELDKILSPAGAGVIGAGLGVVESVIGAISKGAARRRQRALLKQRQAYQTPEEIYDALNATEQRASMGLNQSTLDYLSNRNDARLASSLDIVGRLGGDPNIMADIFGQSQRGDAQIAQMDTEAQLKNFGTWLTALNDLAANKAAEQKSQQDILKDKLQAEGLNLTYGNMAISNGMNVALQALTNLATNKLYDNEATKATRQLPELY